MDKLLWILLVALVTIGCEHTTSNRSVVKDTLAIGHNTLIQLRDTTKPDANNFNLKTPQVWTDSLIEYYINNSNNKLIELLIKDKTSEEWIFDQAISTDTTKYLVFQIGHDESDKGKKNLRFVTDQWIYIDSMTKILYEYNVANDSLIRWTK